MDCDMQKKVTLFVNDFAPGKEGVSNGANLLIRHLAADPNLKITLHNISSTVTFAFSSTHISYGLPLLPIGILLTKYVEKRSDLLHIYGSLTGRLYMRMLKQQPILLTNSSAIHESRIEQCTKHWAKIDKLVVECNRDEARAAEYGFPRDKVSLIYPAVDLDAFTYQPPPDRFTVGFASSPISKDPRGITNRGVDLLVSVARQLKDVQFLLLWRENHYPALQSLINTSPPSNLSVINRILPDMNAFYSRIHCTILPSATVDDCKPCPNSLIESLSAGKPVLLSVNVGIADLVNETRCGLRFAVDVDDIIAKIHHLRDNYSLYQSKARETAQNHFSPRGFVNAYTQLYKTLIASYSTRANSYGQQD